MKNFKALIDSSFGENYSSTYFDGDVLKEGFHSIQHENGLLIYSKVDDKIYLNVIVVTEKGKGFGSALLNEFYDLIAADFYVQTWLYEGNKGLIHWIENKGGEIVEVVKDFWMEGSITKNYSCEICGHPCRCTMTLYHVKNNRKE